MEKKCIKCQVVMDESNFYSERRNKDGLRNTCKVCEGSIKAKPIHKTCSICLTTKDYNLFLPRIDRCRKCDDVIRYSKKRERSKKYYHREVDHISILSKICTKCDIEKEIDLFPLRKESKDGHRNQCINCFSLIKKITRKIYRQKNKVSLRQKDIAYRKQRMSTDHFYRAKMDARNIIRKALSERGYSKKSRTQEILGCSFVQFKEHIESLFLINMNWNNRNEWHIDHIIPLSFANNESELLSINHYKNLRPLWIVDNQLKSDNVELKTNLYDQIIESREFSSSLET